MTSTASNAWIWWTAGAALGAIAVALLCWALGWDWLRRGRHNPRRCPKCWYDLSATESTTCSECGYVAKRERKLHKSRRRWRWAPASLILLIGAAYVAVQPKVQRDGWWSLVSNRMLIRGLPLACDIDDFWCREMARRVQEGHGTSDLSLGRSRAARLMPMTRAEWRMFFERCVEGDQWARPVSEAWQRKYGELLNVWIDGSFHIPDEEPLAEQQVLLELPSIVQVRGRERWPAGVPVYVECAVASWWPQETPHRGAVTPRVEGIETLNVRQHPIGMFLPASARGDLTITFDAQLKYNKTGGSLSEGEVEQLPPIVNEIEIVKAVGDCMIAVDSRPLTDELSGGLVASIETLGGQAHHYLLLDVRAVNTKPFDGMAIGASFEVLKNGEVVLSQPVWWEAGVNQEMRKFNVMSYHRIGNPKPVDLYVISRLIADAQSDDTWQVRLRSDPELALRVFDCDRYWEGEITIPLQVPATAGVEAETDDVE